MAKKIVVQIGSDYFLVEGLPIKDVAEMMECMSPVKLNYDSYKDGEPRYYKIKDEAPTLTIELVEDYKVVPLPKKEEANV